MLIKLLTGNEHMIFEFSYFGKEIPGIVQRGGKYYRYLATEDRTTKIEGEITHLYIETSLHSIPS